ncbi:Glyoxalase/Bleomycin resistance protein/Dihydroxybiphenyl dioxygenase [Lasiosphaeria miniovina]|uniref:Glyoxalase/Bleomycin resistance protein/Dihydroxybiphenyl dioxygenase n=1 Tax=Lasiosphaeria miniovina TaxID=1954250 RepID=A0AA40AVC9_9PEZI|nr:Glyoxalase/Bleomycin resistance protein/Dihydroxybiphenyl dioxygenase [Lasiosphaeria miniovina]KAK0722651.1 Glyoxalase/Bleomycin resistance protein/Dihydroxybiphenyl dioxygenase [Lasiosphaeria miniovina]
MATNPPRKIQLERISHVYYKHENIEAAKKFADDFGFYEAAQVGKTTYYRGYGSEPLVMALEESDKTEFGGAAFAVESEEELEYASKILPKDCKATDVYELKDAPGGGKAVTFYDPVDGFPFHLVYGQTPVEARDPKFPVLKVNFPQEKHRGPNQFQRFQKRPAPVHKLGHFGMCVTNFAKAYEFYSSYFNFHPSELVHNDEGVNITVFFRLDRGAQEVDHHCFFFFEGPKMHVHHSSFETHDFDAQVLGHDWLRHQGYENCWGVGRHVMGSQIFDYWFDPSKFILEHYVDGDLLNMDEPTHHNKAAPDNLHVWGPEVPATFLQ